jgi:hypothetical protein
VTLLLNELNSTKIVSHHEGLVINTSIKRSGLDAYNLILNTVTVSKWNDTTISFILFTVNADISSLER